MVKELVVGGILSEQMIEAGVRLIKRLDQTKSNVQAALWLFISDEKIWKMIIVSPLVKTFGPRNFYKRVLLANKKANKSESVISLNDIRVTDTSNPLINLFRIAISTRGKIVGIRFSRSTIKGTFIEDSYVYRI